MHFWREEIRKVGLFVENRRPPPFGCKVRLTLETPHGSVALETSVVHVILPGTAQQFGMAPGVGLQIAKVEAEVEDMIERYGRSEISCLGPQAKPDEPVDTGEQLLAAQKILTELESFGFYEAVGLDPAASAEAVRARLDALQRLFLRRPVDLRPPQVARLDAALKGLERIRGVLTVPADRLIHDFQVGHHRIPERLEAARQGTGPSVAELRRAWNAALPASVEAAAEEMQRAFAASQVRDYQTAVRAARRALELNPFFAQLETYVEQWERILAQRE